MQEFQRIEITLAQPPIYLVCHQTNRKELA